MKRRFSAIVLILFLGVILGLPTVAFEIKETYPKIANYYLQPLVPQDHYNNLAKYDLLILDVDTQTINPAMFSEIESNNQDIQFLAYIPSQSVNIEDLSSWARWRRMTYNKVEADDWWLKDSQGKIINFSDIWPTIKFVDLGKGWSKYLSDLAAEDVARRDIWDGLFYDMVFANIGWLNNGDIDIDQDGQKDDSQMINDYWQLHMNDLISQTRTKISPKPLVANLDRINTYEASLDGLMIENFSKRESDEENWSVLINHYLNNPFYIINSNTNNIKAMDSYREMRFGLTSTLLGDGYYSFDAGDQSHSQVWWYDEYNVNLGKAESSAQEIKPGLWRRDFEQGIILVNSTDQPQKYFFTKEEFEKINGQQDRRVNDGTKINWINLNPQDGIVLLKINIEIKNDGFINGIFVRVFNSEGQQVKNGFFAYKDNLPGNQEILISDLDNDDQDEILVNHDGLISVYQQAKEIISFKPYQVFDGPVSLAVGDLNNDGIKEIITIPGLGGGPHLKVFSRTGQLLSEFMAYDHRFRGGADLTVGDVNDDGFEEIITGAGSGGGPHVKIISQDGQILDEFMAYDERFRGGVNLAVGDVNNDGLQEIIIGTGRGGGPHVKVVSATGQTLNEFMAYNPEDRNGIMVMSDDIDQDGLDEILAGTINF